MAELLKDRLKVGQRVKFRRSHDKFTELTGTITAIPKGNDDVVHVKTEADGKICEVSGLETVHAADVTVLREPAPPEQAANAQAATQQRQRNRTEAEKEKPEADKE